MKISSVPDRQSASLPIPGAHLWTGGAIHDTARIWLREKNRPVRLTSRGRRYRTTGLYMSTKVGRQQPWESRNEHHAFWRAEVDPNVLSYAAQPHTLEMIVDGRRLEYTPDRQDDLADGSTEIIEVKDRFEEDRDPEYTRKLEIASHLYAQIGWRFRIQEKADIESQPSFAAVKEIQAYGRTIVPIQQIIALQDAFNRTNTLSVGDAIEVIGAASPHSLYAMMIRRLIRIDISRGLHRDADVEAVTL